MKLYTNIVLSEEQDYFNYLQNQVRMVVEGAYGQLKDRWQVLIRKNELPKHVTLACIVLHIIWK